jgi:hypothetical protein
VSRLLMEWGWKTSTVVLSQQDCEAGGSLAWEMPGSGGKRPRQSRSVSVLPDGAGPASETERHTPETGVNTSLKAALAPNLADMGWRRRAPGLS